MAEQVIAGRAALVTGGARGIGRAIASALAAEGVKVALTDIEGPLAEATAEEIRREAPAGARVFACALDVRDRSAFAQTADRIERELAPIDILVNNAGIMCLGALLDQDAALDERQIDVNLRGVLHGVRAVLPRMLQRGRGHVVNIASVVGKVAPPHAAVYAATKHAVVGLTEGLRHDYEGSGVFFSYVLPSFVQTELISGTGRLRYPPPVRPEDVASAVISALRYRRVDVYVPRFARLGAILPALLPRDLAESIGRLFRVDRVFRDIEPAAREAYIQRILREEGGVRVDEELRSGERKRS